jgi:SNF2 family DNA or RNA helicase
MNTIVTKPVLYKPMRHQTATLKLMERSPIIFDMSDPGTGKTYVQIMAFAKRRRRKRNPGKCMLVIAPKSLLRSAWEDDFHKFAPDMRCAVADATHREKAFALDANVYITNTDAVTWLTKQKPKFFARFDTLVVDEVSAFKHHTSNRSKALNHIKHYFTYRSVLSGTPNSNTILDVWNPMQILDDGRRLGKQFYGFRASVCAPQQNGKGAQMIAWADKEGAGEVIFGLIHDIAIRHRFDDCIDIPATSRHTVAYHLAPKQLAAYLSMERDQIAWLEAVVKGVAGAAPSATVIASSAAAVTTKLLQIASGAVYENANTYHVVDLGRYELVMDLVAERVHPLVFFLWKHQRDELVKIAESRGLRYCVLDGAATDRERIEMVHYYQAGWYDVMFAHPKSAAHGLTFTRGTSTIWASPTYDLEWWVQGNRRQARAGQTQKTEIIVVLAEGTIDERVYARVLVKNDNMQNLLALFTPDAP